MTNPLRLITPARIITTLTGLMIAWYMPYNISSLFPVVGRDAKYFLSRLVDTALHYRVNGLSIQWYTPTFGGGLPAYPHPLNSQFSLPQFMAFFLDPWAAVTFSYAVYIFVGYIAAYLLLRRPLAMGWAASTLGAALFSANGFYLEHIATGHLNFQAFPLLPIFLLVLLDSKISSITAAAIIGLTSAVMVYSASTYPAVFILLSLLVCLPLMYLIRPSAFCWGHIVKASALGIALSLGLTLSKLYAVLSFMRFFPRIATDEFTIPLHQAPLGLLLQLVGVMGLAPIFALTGSKMNGILQLLQGYTGGYVGLWELDLSMSPVLWLLLGLGAIALLRKIPHARKALTPLKKDFWLAVALLLLATELTLEFTFARGLFYPHLRELPILNALHINSRFGSAFIMPLALLGAAIFAHITKAWSTKQTAAFFIPLNLLILVSLTAYQLLPVGNLQRRDFDISSLLNAHKAIQQGETFNIEQIANVTDQRTFDQHASNTRPWEPIFGYNKETFEPQVTVGPVNQITDGAFNMTNPTSLVYPEVNGNAARFSRIPVSQQAQLQAFTAHRNPEWNLPVMQHVWNIVALITLIIEVLIFAWLLIKKLKAQK